MLSYIKKEKETFASLVFGLARATGYRKIGMVSDVAAKPASVLVLSQRPIAPRFLKYMSTADVLATHCSNSVNWRYKFELLIILAADDVI